MKYRSLILGIIVGVMSLPLVSQAAVCAINHPTTSDDNDAYGRVSGSHNTAESFTVASACVLTAIGESMQTIGSISDNPIYIVEADSSGAPSGVALDTSANITGLTSSFAWATSTFSGGITLNAGTTYWIVNSRTGSLSDPNFYLVDSLDAGLTGVQVFDGSSWTTRARKIRFEVDGTAPGPAVSPTNPWGNSAWW